MYRNLEKKNLFKKLQDKFCQNPFTAIKEELQKEDPQPPSLDIPEEKIIEHFKNNYCDNEKKKTDFTHPSFYLSLTTRQWMISSSRASNSLVFSYQRRKTNVPLVPIAYLMLYGKRSQLLWKHFTRY